MTMYSYRTIAKDGGLMAADKRIKTKYRSTRAGFSPGPQSEKVTKARIHASYCCIAYCPTQLHLKNQFRKTRNNVG